MSNPSKLGGSRRSEINGARISSSHLKEVKIIKNRMKTIQIGKRVMQI
jgi:hypothetical protein